MGPSSFRIPDVAADITGRRLLVPAGSLERELVASTDARMPK
jgi:hypothetical protein